jgi:hypothetical protein
MDSSMARTGGSEFFFSLSFFLQKNENKLSENQIRRSSSSSTAPGVVFTWRQGDRMMLRSNRPKCGDKIIRLLMLYVLQLMSLVNKRPKRQQFAQSGHPAHTLEKEENDRN